MRVLIAQADQPLAEEHARQLRMDGHHAAVALSARAAGLRLAELPDALVLCQLDSAVETIVLLRVLRAGEIPRSDATVPVLVIGADSDEDQLRYYQAGADVALPAACSPLLISAALGALARRTGSQHGSRLVRVGRLRIDHDARTAQVDEQPLALTRLEFDLLHMLASQPGKAFTRAELTRNVWGYDPAAVGPSRTIDSTAHRLRRKLQQAGADPIPHNVRGVGWRLST